MKLSKNQLNILYDFLDIPTLFSGQRNSENGTISLSIDISKL